MASVIRQNGIQLIKRQKKLLLTQCIKFNSTNTKSETNILKSVYNDIPKINSTIHDFVWQNLDRWPDKTAVVCAATGHGYTYEQTYKMSISFAASLRTKLKLNNGDVVAIILPNIPEYPCTVLGILEAGCVASMMNPAYTPHELKRHLEIINCKAIVTSTLSYSNVTQALRESNLNLPTLVIGQDLPEGAISFAEFAEDRSVDTDCLKFAQRSSKDLAVLPFSSGTSGLPKAVQLTHGSVVAMNQMIYDPDVLAIDEATESFQSAVPAVLPFFHIFGFNAVMMNLLGRGCKLITFPAFNPELFLQTIVKQRVEHLYIVPPMVLFLGNHPAVSAEMLSGLKGVVSGAAPLAAKDVEPLMNKNNKLTFRQGYGLTETNGGVSVGRKTDSNHSAVGHLFGSCQLKVADVDTQEALGPDQEGEIWVRGPHLMSGYLGSDEEAIVDGWYRTGDLGRYDGNGYLYVTDRLKDLIKVKGFQVAPAELETVLRSHPDVTECGVVGSMTGKGEEPIAFATLKPNAKTTERELKEFLNGQLASFKHVDKVAIVPEIPKNAAGILRHVTQFQFNKLTFRQGYGLTETNGGVSVGRKTDGNHSAVGHLFGSCQLKVADVDNEEALGPDQEGEIWVRGPHLMSGYLGSDEEAIVDGWYRTGDLGRYDGNGYLYVTDRLKDLIKVKGFQVAPAELETVLRSHPDVTECGVVGSMTGKGEEPIAFATLKPNAKTTERELKEFLNGQLASFKHVDKVAIVPEIPKNAAGKVLRKALKEKYL